MKGFPRCIGTKTDLDNLMAMPEYRAAAQAMLWEITMNRFKWVPDKVLKDEEEFKPSATTKIVHTQDDNGKQTILRLKLVEDENSLYFRLGYE